MLCVGRVVSYLFTNLIEKMPGVERLLAQLGVESVTTLKEPSELIHDQRDLTLLLDQLRNIIRDKKDMVNPLMITADVLSEFMLVVETMSPVASTVELALRCIVNALCDNDAAQVIFTENMKGLHRLVTLLHALSGTTAFHATKLLFMLVAQRADSVVPILLSLNLLLEQSPDTSTRMCTLTDVLAGQLRRCISDETTSNVTASATTLFIELCKLIYAVDHQRDNKGLKTNGSRQWTQSMNKLFAVVCDVAIRPHWCAQSLFEGGLRSGTLSDEEQEQEECRRFALQVVMVALAEGWSMNDDDIRHKESHRYPDDDCIGHHMVGQLISSGGVDCLCSVLSELLFTAARTSDDPNPAYANPLLIILTKIAANHAEGKRRLKELVFPNQCPRAPPTAVVELDAADAATTTTSENGDEDAKNNENDIEDGNAPMNHAQMQAAMDPTDAPRDTFRGQLIRLMISLNTPLKRCVGELLFELCDRKSSEFVLRTGFGNAIHMLNIHGLVG